jgi:hypothetical protein
MKEIAKIKINLMEKNIEVAKFEIEIYDRFVAIDEYDVLSPSHMPAIVEHIGMLNWLLSRCMSYTTHWQAFLFDAILQNGERNKFAPFILSLNTNSMSVSDWYWLKPEQNIEFQYYAQKIEFLLTTWEQSNWFDHKSDIDSFNHHMGKDVFVYDEYTQPLKAPVFAIRGDVQNQFTMHDSKICIKQRKTKEKIQDELSCLMELGKVGVVVPTIKTEHTDNCLDTKMFNYATRQNGMDFIIKDILTSNDHKLVPLEWFWKNIQPWYKA